jgi:hypothetical protein
MRVKKIFLWFTIVFLSGCIGPSIQSLIDSADQRAAVASFSKEMVGDGYFELVTYKNFVKSDDLTIYIEGDGKGWITRTQISQNPTPHNPVALYLSLIDQTAASIAYVSRPCQFHPSRSQKNCVSKYWASARYSDEVIASTNYVISELKRKSGAKNISLVGFSGGATVALLVAARRDDVVLVKTVAGNLDHQAFTSIHKVTPLAGSLNPVSYSPQLSKLDQLHFVGENDKVVPRQIFDSYYRLVGGSCNKLKVVKGVSHGIGWLDEWPKLNKLEIDCQF